MQAVNFFKALSDPTRLRLVLLLRQHELMCVCDLTDLLGQPQPTVSRHLNHLKRAGILSCERRGTWMWYGLNRAMPNWCKQVIDSIDDDTAIQNTVIKDSIIQNKVNDADDGVPTKKCC